MRGFLADTVSWLLPFAAISAAGFAPFVLASSLDQVFQRNYFKRELVEVRSSVYFLRAMGLLDPRESLIALARSLLAWGGALAGLAAGSYLLNRSGSGGGSKGRLVAARLAALALWAGGVGTAVLSLDAGTKYRCLNIACLLALGTGLIRSLRHGSPYDPWRASMTVFSVFSLALLARIVLNVTPEHYGFYLTPPALLVFAVLLLRVAPAWLRPLAGQPRYHAAGVLAILLLLAAKDFKDITYPMYRAHRLELAGAAGRMRVIPYRRFVHLKEALVYLQRHPDAAKTLLVVPGSILNFLLEIPNPIYQRVFTPPELNAPGVEDETIRQIETKRPAAILIVDWNQREFGYEGLGRDYGKKLTRAIHRDYRLEQAFGRPGVQSVLYTLP